MKNVRINIHNLPDKSCVSFCGANICSNTISFFFFLREFQSIASALDDNSLLSSQDTNQFLV